MPVSLQPNQGVEAQRPRPSENFGGIIRQSGREDPGPRETDGPLQHTTHTVHLDTQPSRFALPVCKESRPLPFGNSARGTEHRITPPHHHNGTYMRCNCKHHRRVRSDMSGQQSVDQPSTRLTWFDKPACQGLQDPVHSEDVTVAHCLLCLAPSRGGGNSSRKVRGMQSLHPEQSTNAKKGKD